MSPRHNRIASNQTTPSITRRNFLSATTAAATFTVMRPALAFGSEANSRVTVGIVGQGGRGSWIANHVAGHAGFQITAVADYFPETAEAAGERLKVPKDRRFSGLEAHQRLIQSKVDAVFLETPPYFFPIHARAAVAAGCHVYVAKPVAVDVPGCLAIKQLGQKASRNKQVFQVDFQTRTDPFHIEAIQKVHDGMLGKLGLMNTYYHDECFADPPREKTIENYLRNLAWCNDVALGGEYVVNCDIHAMDVALWVAQELPVSAVGYACRNRPNPQGDSPDCYAISYQFKSGLVWSNTSEHVRNGTDFRSGCQAYGQKAWLEANYAGKVFIRGIEDGYAGGESKNLYEEGMQRNVDKFHRCIVEGRYDNPTVEPSVNSNLAVILGRDAARKGRQITWEELLKDTARLEPDLSGLRK